MATLPTTPTTPTIPIMQESLWHRLGCSGVGDGVGSSVVVSVGLAVVFVGSVLVEMEGVVFVELVIDGELAVDVGAVAVAVAAVAVAVDLGVVEGTMLGITVQKLLNNVLFDISSKKDNSGYIEIDIHFTNYYCVE